MDTVFPHCLPRRVHGNEPPAPAHLRPPGPQGSRVTCGAVPIPATRWRPPRHRLQPPPAAPARLPPSPSRRSATPVRIRDRSATAPGRRRIRPAALLVERPVSASAACMAGLPVSGEDTHPRPQRHHGHTCGRFVSGQSGNRRPHRADRGRPAGRDRLPCPSAGTPTSTGHPMPTRPEPARCRSGRPCSRHGCAGGRRPGQCGCRGHVGHGNDWSRASLVIVRPGGRPTGHARMAARGAGAHARPQGRPVAQRCAGTAVPATNGAMSGILGSGLKV